MISFIDIMNFEFKQMIKYLLRWVFYKFINMFRYSFTKWTSPWAINYPQKVLDKDVCTMYIMS